MIESTAQPPRRLKSGIIGKAFVIVAAILFAWSPGGGGLEVGDCVTNPGRGIGSTTVKQLDCSLEGASHELVPATAGCAVRIDGEDLCVVER